MSLRRVITIVAAVVALAVAAWYFATPDDDGAGVRSRLQSLAHEINTSTTDGVGADARVAELGTFLTDDIDVDLGHGAVPIQGRETVLGMAARLQPRTAAFTLKFEDVSVVINPGGETADVHLTATFVRRSITTGEESFDAREFMLAMRRLDGVWKVARVTALETLTR